jgi:flagellar basal-body rod modification protein FlgD
MSTTLINALTSSTSTTSASSSASSLSSLTADDFLKLLLTELENQDPTDPVKTSDMLQEFSTLSQVVQSEKNTEYLKSLNEYISSLSNSQAVSYLGKTISYSCDEVTVSNGTGGNLSFDLASDASDVTATIYNSSGTAVTKIDLGSLSSGSYTYSWDGTNSSGTTLSDGTYSVKYSATSTSGSSISVTTSGTAEVTGVVYKSGVAYLVTANGDIPMSSVTGVS